MMLADFVVDTLRSNHIERVNFPFDNALVYPSGFRADIAQCIGDGLIQLTNGPAAEERDAARRYPVAAEEVSTLRSLVTTGSAGRYAFNGI